ncbi:hypothetical protein cypCar_00004395 [Cyprinus carpio]|nr:hypothetical protein cypCar_00004395 [Cyprinus carpio]
MVPTSSGGFSSSALFVLSVALMLQAVLGDGKTLVLLDNPNIRDTHSIFFRSLADRERHCMILRKYYNSQLHSCPQIVGLTLPSRLLMILVSL